MDLSAVREPEAPYKPLGREPAEGEEFCVDENGMRLSKINGILSPPFIKDDTYSVLQEKLTLKESDLVIATYPKCGTTWMQQVVLLMLCGGDKAQITDIMTQSPWIEMKYAKASLEAVLSVTPSIGDRRVWKTHADQSSVPWAANSPGKKIIVARNPFDAAVSMFHHAHDVELFRYSGEWDHFLGLYSKGLVESGNFWEWHSRWYKHHQTNAAGDTFWTSYEDMKADLPKVVRGIAKFIGLELSDDEVDRVCEGSGFSVMKQQFAEQDAIKEAKGIPVKKNHIRQGETGAWKKKFTEEQEKAFRALHETKCKELGLPLDLFLNC